MINASAPRSRFLIFVSLFSLCILEMAVSSLLLENFSRMGWSATFAEDSDGYLLVARYFSGERIAYASQALLRYRLFSPFIPFVVSLLGKMFPLTSAFFLLNSFLWIGATFFFYFFIQDLLKRDDLALACSIIFTTSLPVLVWGLPIMVDMGAYFFVALILYSDQKIKTLKSAAVLGIVTGLAILTKPTLTSVLLFLIISHAGKGGWRRALIIAGVSGALVSSVYFSLGLEVKDFLSYSSPRHQGVFYVLNAFFFCFHAGLVFVFFSWKTFKEESRFYILFILSVLSFYLPFVHNPRLLFMLYPAMIPLISVGAKEISHRLSDRFHRDGKLFFCLTILFMVVLSHVLTACYLYITRTIGWRSIEDLLKIL
jgi:4-amino-4-deoxy-L-arabinose transferase-like glycosyltransferase